MLLTCFCFALEGPKRGFRFSSITQTVKSCQQLCPASPEAWVSWRIIILDYIGYHVTVCKHVSHAVAPWSLKQFSDGWSSLICGRGSWRPRDGNWLPQVADQLSRMKVHAFLQACCPPMTYNTNRYLIWITDTLAALTHIISFSSSVGHMNSCISLILKVGKSKVGGSPSHRGGGGSGELSPTRPASELLFLTLDHFTIRPEVGQPIQTGLLF